MGPYNTFLKTAAILIMIFGSVITFAHNEPHNSSPITEDTVRQGSSDHNANTTSTARADSLTKEKTQQQDSNSKFAPLVDFPNLHPMVVHFPIVLLLLAFFSQLAALFVYRKPLSWVTLFLLAGGFLGAILASRVFHVHPEGLPASVHDVFEAHEGLAYITLWLSGIALVFKIISHFVFDTKKWAELIVLLVILGAAITVTLTGHLGAEMVYLDQVGPGGNMVEQHQHN